MKENSDNLQNSKKKNYSFKTKRADIKATFYSFINLIRNIHLASVTKKDLEKHYSDESGNMLLTNEENERFSKVDYELYLTIKGRRYNGIMSPYSDEKNQELKKELDRKLYEHIYTVSQICPYINFDRIYKKAKNVVYRVREIHGDHEENIKGASFVDYPIINLHLDKDSKNVYHKEVIMTHEFTHFLCKKPKEKRTYYNHISSFRNEGITQYLTIMSLLKRNKDNNYINYARGIYPLNLKYTDILVDFLGDNVIFTSYINRDNLYINEAIKNENDIHSAGEFNIDKKFLATLSYEEDNFHAYLYQKKKVNNKLTMNDFPYMCKLLMFISSVYDLNPDYIVAEEKKEKIKRFFEDAEYTLESLYKMNIDQTNRKHG